jgi:hypothetical protein
MGLTFKDLNLLDGKRVLVVSTSMKRGMKY